MDTLSRKKTEEKKKAHALQKQQAENHAADDYNPRIRPRETHPDPVDSETRVSRNLNKLNRELVKTPAAQKIPAVREKVKVTTVRKPMPVALIVSVVMITAVFIYMLSLNVQIEEYSRSISAMEGEIVELKEEATRLEVELESKYDLDEIERISTQEYGMVSADSLPKTYISVNEEGEVYETSESANQNGVSKLISGFLSAVRSLFE